MIVKPQPIPIRTNPKIIVSNVFGNKKSFCQTMKNTPIGAIIPPMVTFILLFKKIKKNYKNIVMA